MKEYTLPYPSNYKRNMAVFITMLIVVNIILAIRDYSLTGKVRVIENPLSIFPFLILAAVIGIVYLVQQRKYTKLTIRLQVDEHYISTYAEGMHDVTITKEEATSIKELPNGDLIIEKEGARFGIPQNLPQYGEIREVLSNWMPITPANNVRGKFTIKNTVPQLIFFGSFIAGIKFTEAPWSWLLVSVCLISGFYIFSIYHKFKNKFASRARERWIYLAIMTIAILRVLLRLV